MAYVDRQSGTRRIATLGSAALIQGAIGTVLILGLAQQIDLRPKDGPLIAIPFRNPPPVPKDIPSPKPNDKQQAATDSFVDQVPPKFDVNNGVALDAGPTVDPAPYVAPTPVPTFTVPTPRPLFTIKGPRPANSQSQWVTTDDYPSRDIRAEHTGTARYRVVVGTNGRVTSCEIVKSSGWAGLDQATCANVSKRARFEPGTDENGAKAVDTYTGTVSWQIPE